MTLRRSCFDLKNVGAHRIRQLVRMLRGEWVVPNVRVLEYEVVRVSRRAIASYDPRFYQARHESRLYVYILTR